VNTSRFARVARAALVAGALLAGTAATARADSLDGVLNIGFEEKDPLGPSTLVGQYISGPSAAKNWKVWNNSYGTTTTKLVNSTLPGGGKKMLHVKTDGRNNGLFQYFTPHDSYTAEIDVFVLSGQVSLWLGHNPTYWARDYSSTTGQWERLSASYDGGVQQIVLYSYLGPAEFYLDYVTESPVNAVPEPGAMAFGGTAGLALVGGLLRWRSARRGSRQ